MPRTVLYYLLAIVTVTVAALLRWSLGDIFGPTNYPFFLFFLAVAVCARYGTLGSSLTCAVLGGLTADYFFVHPRFTVGPTSFHSLVAMISYLIVGIAIALFAEANRRAIQRAEQAGARLKVALSVANASTFDWDPQTNALRWPDQYHGVFGSRGGAQTLDEWLSHVHQEDRQRVKDLMLGFPASGQDHLSMDFRIYGADGRQHWEHARLAAIDGRGSDATQISGAVIDVTDLKMAEAVLVRTEKLASAGKLAATVAHEINNPLAAATNLLYLAKQVAVTDRVKDYLNAADLQLARVAAATKRTLAFYKEHTEPVPVAIREVLESAASGLEHKRASKEAALDWQYRDEAVVAGIAGELVHAFSNLLANSMDAVPKHGKVVVRVSRNRNWKDPAGSVMRVSIADNGQGISRADREHLFEPFFTTKGVAGTGLGLWVTQDIIRRHGGRIRIRSQAEGKNTWTVVSVTLPAPLKPAGQVRAGKQVASAAGVQPSVAAG